MPQPALKPIICAGCGCCMGGSFYDLQDVFCRECIRSLGHRWNEIASDLFEDMDNLFCQTLKHQAWKILNKSNIAEDTRWWEASDKKELDTPEETCYDINRALPD